MPDPIDYDRLAATYDGRYAVHEYVGVHDTLLRFAVGAAPSTLDVLEIGCGTGHWLAALEGRARIVAGVDPSRGMLGRARAAAPGALLVQGCAEALPWSSATYDRVFVINAFHHFTDPAKFVREATRVLRPGGGVLIMGLDPHTGNDQWWIYDYFAGALSADRARYPSTAALRQLLGSAGFTDCETRVAQHWPDAVSVREAAARGLLERRSTSQLLVIRDEEYEAGLARIRALDARGGDEPVLRADLRLYATQGWIPRRAG